MKKQRDERLDNYKPMSCRNCGLNGHIYKNCPHPIMSFGLICYKLDDNNELKFLMLQRKDSLSFMEFIRGKYEIYDHNYIKSLLSNMTINERNMILKNNFDMIWNYLWYQNNNNIKITKEYLESKQKYEILVPSNFFQNYIKTISTIFNEQEWGFPKGRRKLKEYDIECAIREFYEETRIKRDDIHIYSNIEPFEEIFFGTNNVLYKHSYYIAKLTNNNITASVDNKCLEQIREVRSLKWFNFNEVISHIKKYNVERIELFKCINEKVKKIEKI